MDTGIANAAAAGHEYTALSGSVTIPAGDVSFPIDVTPKQINHLEGTTNVAVALASGSGYTASSGEPEVGITNTDGGTISFSSQTFTVGVTTGLTVAFKNYWGRYVADTLTPSGFDSTIISPQAATVTTSADPNSPAALPVLGVGAGNTQIALADPAGNTATQPAASGHMQVTVSGTPGLFDGQTVMVKVTLKDGSGRGLAGHTLIIKSDDPNILRVPRSETGKTSEGGNGSQLSKGQVIFMLRGAHAGTTTLTISPSDDRAVSVAIQVTVLPVKLSILTQPPVTLSSDRTAPQHKQPIAVAVTDPATGNPVSNVNVQLNSDHESIAGTDVNQGASVNGIATIILIGNGVGDATIQATVADDFSVKSQSIAVSVAPGSI